MNRLIVPLLIVIAMLLVVVAMSLNTVVEQTAYPVQVEVVTTPAPGEFVPRFNVQP